MWTVCGQELSRSVHLLELHELGAGVHKSLLGSLSLLFDGLLVESGFTVELCNGAQG